MDVRLEAPALTDARLRLVLAAAAFDPLPGTWWLHEFAPAGFPGEVRPDAVALVRDADGWSQLVPVAAGDEPPERLRLWCFHFPEGLDNSGFVGWLASHLKRTTGSGVVVLCGRNSARGGIYDYWGCPEHAADAVLAAIAELRGRPAGLNLDGVTMVVRITGDTGVVGPDTRITFVQRGSRVLGRYGGGRVVRGCLVGTLSGSTLTFRFVQREAGRDGGGTLHAGHSRGEISRSDRGSLRLTEHFTWSTREGAGTNLFEEAP